MPTPLSGVVPAGRPNYLVSYNDFSFDPATTYTSSVSCKPVPDASGRTIKYVEASLTLHTVVMRNPALGTTDAQFDALKQQLTAQGGALYYRDKGFGDFTVNTPGGRKRDVAWGPIPQILNARPVGDSYAWEFDWAVVTRYPECDAATFEGRIMEWVYQVGYEFENGFETRRVTGHIEVPLTRAAQGDRFLRQTADDYREQIFPACPRFFRPLPYGFTLSDDRRRLDFRFAFQQFPGPAPPPGVLDVKLSIGNHNANPMNFTTWMYTIRADYQMVPGVPRSAAAQHFVEVYQAKRAELLRDIKAARAAAAQNKVNKGAGEKKKDGPNFVERAWAAAVENARHPGRAAVQGAAAEVRAGVVAALQVAMPGLFKNKPDLDKDAVSVLPVHFDGMNPDYYGPPKAGFGVTFQLLATAPHFLTAALFSPIEGNPESADLWAQNLGAAFAARGGTGGRFDPADDMIIDLCRPAQERRRIRGVKPPVKAGVVRTIGGTIPVDVDEDTSWIEWGIDVEVVQHDSVMVTKPLPEDRTARLRQGGVRTLRTPAAIRDGAGGGFDARYLPFVPPEDAAGKPGFKPGGAGALSEIISSVIRPAAASYWVVLRGAAARVGFKPTIPDLVSIGGVPAVAANDKDKNDGWRIKPVGNVGVPIFVAEWQLRYRLPCAPGPASRDPRSGAAIGGAAAAVGGAVGRALRRF